MGYKVGLVKCLIDRIYRINNTWRGFHLNLEAVFEFLKRNLYPEELLFKISKTFLDNKFQHCPESNEPTSEKMIYFKLS